MTPGGIVVLGFGGHARSVADVALAVGVASLEFIEPKGRPGEGFRGFPVHTHLARALAADWALFPAAGDNARRERQMREFSRYGKFCTLVSPRAYVGCGVRIDEGTLVAHLAHVGVESIVGEGCIVNTGAVVEHECRIGRFVHISVNATVAGRCTIGERTFLGAGAVVIDGVEVAPDVVVGAGAVVVEDIREPGVYVGVPARAVRR